MPNRDKTGPEGKGAGTGRGKGNCSTEKQLEDLRKKDSDKDDKKSSDKNDDTKGVGRGGEPRGCGKGHCGGRRKGKDGITYFT